MEMESHDMLRSRICGDINISLNLEQTSDEARSFRLSRFTQTQHLGSMGRHPFSYLIVSFLLICLLAFAKRLCSIALLSPGH